jgi:two-component system cell cycle sensor histidine kinase/response regulator CckA
LEARSADEALVLSEILVGGIDLLLADVVLPGMSGHDLATEIARHRPETRVLYISGHCPAALAEVGILPLGLPFLAKPFTAEQLARRVRQTLDGREPTRPHGGL